MVMQYCVVWFLLVIISKHSVSSLITTQSIEDTSLLTETSSLPNEYDPRGIDNCIPNVGQQGPCGNCYAFSSLFNFQFRYCKFTNKKVELSIQEATACDSFNSKCEGGNVDNTLNYFSINGVSANACMPFDYQKLGSCTFNKCTSGYVTNEKYFCKKGTVTAINTTALGAESMQLIKNEIISHGSVSTTIASKAGSFLIYYAPDNSSVFSEDDPNSSIADHAIVLIGWGADYWIIANSWGPYWGYRGFAKVKMGIRKIGEMVYFCEPIMY